MKKKFFLFVLFVLIVTCLTTLFSCGEMTKEKASTEKKPKSLTVIEKHIGDYVIGEDVDLSEIRFTVLYNDKTTENVTLTDIMLSEEDREKFFQPGVHTVTISYLGITTPLQISVVEKEGGVEYTATFYSLGGTEYAPLKTKVVTAFPLPEREGYTFDGWYVDVGFSNINSDTSYKGNRATEPYTLTKDTIFYAKWLDKRLCDVTFVCDAGIILPLSPDWNLRSEEERLQEGDIFVNYLTDESGIVYGQTVTRQSRNIILPINSSLWTTADTVDYLKTGDVIAGFKKDRSNHYLGLIVSRTNIVLDEESIHYGEKITVDDYDLPLRDIDGHELVIEGKQFVNWNVTNGNPDKVTIDLLVRASFKTKQCTVSIYYFNTKNEEAKLDKTLDYGTVFNYSSYVMPTKEGYNSRWVVYYNHSKQYICPECGFTETIDSKTNLVCTNCNKGILEEYGFEEIPENSHGSITLKEEYTLIQPYHVIKTYSITIQNGVVEQQVEALQSGNIILEPIYEDPETERKFTVDWNATFNYTTYTQQPKLNTPATISDGYSSQWCFVVRDSDDKLVWYNVKGQIWSDIEEAFIEVEREDGEGENYWILRDAQDEYIATIRNGIPTEIKSDLSLYAKYLKKDRTVNLRRTYESVRGVMVKMTIPFYNEFSMYDPFTYYNPGSYEFAPQPLTDSDPSPDVIIQDKLFIYEKVRLYELFLLQQRYQTILTIAANNAGFTEEMQYDFAQFHLWLSINAADYELMCQICLGREAGSYNTTALQSYVESYFGKRVWNRSGDNSKDFRSLFSEYTQKTAEVGDGFYTMSNSEFLYNFYLDYIGVFNDSRLGFASTPFERTIDFDHLTFDDDEDGNVDRLWNEDDFRRTWLYYKDSAGYKFYRCQINRSADLFQEYLLGLNCFEGVEGYSLYGSLYQQYKDTADFMYYYCGLEQAETEIKRAIRLYLVSKENIRDFYLYKDTNKDVKDMASFYSTTGTADWSIDWYKNAEMTQTGRVDFFNEKINIIDNTNLYCKDIDNKRYELTFYYNYDFLTGGYQSNILPVTGVEEIEVHEYESNITRTQNGVLLTYEFIGWYDTSFYTYLTTGYRGNALRILSSHSENREYYAHYSCQTTYTVKIYDTTQSMAYAGVKEYNDGYAVDKDTIEYKLPAGTILSTDEIYKGIKTGETSYISGQEYYRQKRYIDYFDEYYDLSNASSPYYYLLSLLGNYEANLSEYGASEAEAISKAAAISAIEEILGYYSDKIALYKAVLSSVQKGEYYDFEMATYEYYLGKYTLVSTHSGDEKIADWNAFIDCYIDFLADISAKKYVDVSSFTIDIQDYLVGMAKFKLAKNSAQFLYDSDQWDLFHSNFYTYENGVYVRVSTNAFDSSANYYTYLYSTDYEYENCLISLLSNYLAFLNGYETYKNNRNNYATHPMHLYVDSMADVNAANDYDYEGAGELKYRFIDWYVDEFYSAAFLNRKDDEYYEATQDAYLDQADWEDVYDNYWVFNSLTNAFEQATSVYSDAITYYLYDAGAYYATDVAHLYYTHWDSIFSLLYVYQQDTRSYVALDEHSVYDPEAVYYWRYKDVTSVLVAQLKGWSTNYKKYYIKVGERAYEQATDVYEPTATYYASSGLYMSFIVDKDITLYARWMDISRGTEGLVYELVTDMDSGEQYYVVIDFVNKKQSMDAGYYNCSEQYYFVTTNDNGMIPEIVAQEGDKIELLIPPTITSYQEATAEATAAWVAGEWATRYSNYLVYNTITYMYEAATKEFSATTVYYNKNVQKVYPVIGIKKLALDRYKTYITEVNLPLNLYFIEEGAFNLCPIVSVSRAKARTTETELNYVVVDERDKIGIAIYQKDAYTGNIRGNGTDPYVYTFPAANTILTYAVANTNYISYTVLAGTVRVGDYAFRGSNLTEISFGNTPVIEEIGAYAFSLSGLTAFVVYSSIKSIDEYAFYHATDLARVSVQADSVLRSIGKSAFDDTAWFKTQKGLVKLNWRSDSQSVGAIVGYNVPTGGGYVYYDTNNGSYVTYNEQGQQTEGGMYYAISSDDESGDRILFRLTMEDNRILAITLSGVVIETKIVFIADNAFDVQLGFKSFILNAVKLEYIGDEAFSNCPLLETITFNNAVAGIDIGHRVFSGKGSNSLTIVDTADIVMTGDNWSEYDNVIRD